jgi:hypothetical protein
MAHEQAIAAAFDGLWGKSSERNWILGRLGLPGGGSPVFDVPDKPGYKYVNKGAEGEQGQVIARDGIGVANTYNQRVRMRYEFGEYVIREAEQISGGGGSGGASNLDALTDVTLTTPANGNTLAYNSATSQWINVVPAGGAGGAPSPHAHSSVHHTGLLPWAELNKSGSNLTAITTRLHADLQGMTANDHHDQQHVLATGTALGADHTISGAAVGEVLRALSATTAAFDQLKHTDLDPTSILPNQHHNQAHELVGPDHFDSGLTSGYTIRAYNATGYQWDQLQHDDLGGVHPNQHHYRSHDIITGDADNPTLGPVHTIVGTTFDIPGAVAPNTLGLLRPSPAPGAVAQILRTDNYGGIQLDTDLLYVDGANNRVGFNVVPGAGPLGGAAAVDMRVANVGDITQRIRQLHLQTGRLWRIEDEFGNELIVLDSVGNLQSGRPGFVSGLTGWQITPGGNAEFNNIWARGELHATVFVKDEVHATGGTFMVATAGVLHDDAKIDSSTTDDDELWVKSTAVGTVPLNVKTTSPTFTGTILHVHGLRNELQINDPPSGPATYFQPGEILRVKTEINPVPPDTLRLADVWLEVMSATQDDGFSRYSVVKQSGSDCTIPKGTAIVTYRHRGEGSILMTSDWRSDWRNLDESYTPYIDIFTTGQSPWDANDPLGIIPRLRIGQLKGVGVQGVSGISQYGMIAGKNLSDTNAGYIIASDQQLALYRVPIRVNDGANTTGQWLPDGNMKLGKNIGQVSTTSFEVDTVSGDVWIGDRSGSINPGDPAYLHWDQFHGTLYIRGDLIVGGSGGNGYVTVVDAKQWDSETLTAANTYSNGVGTSAQNYFNGLRILRVAGTWTPKANAVDWSTLTLYLSNNTTRTVNARTGQAVTALTYLYADLTGSGAINMIVQTGTISIPSPNYMLIAIITPGLASLPVGDRIVTVTVVAGNTLISGGSIITGSIVANNMAADSISANSIQGEAVHAEHIHASVYQTAGSRRGMVVDGVFGTSTVTPAVVTWTGIRVIKYDSGAPVTIADGSTTLTGGPSGTIAQTYFYIKHDDLSGCQMLFTKDDNFGAIEPEAIMIAVASYSTTSKSATVVMVAGGVIISGDNIKAGTVSATNIHADVYTAMGNRRVMAIQGSFSNHATLANTVTWTQLTVRKYDGTQVTVNASAPALPNGLGISVRTYFYIAYTASGTVGISVQTGIGNVPADAIMIAVVDPGPASGKVSITMVNGGTYISGDSIITGSIVAGNIQAGTITANEIHDNTLTLDEMASDVTNAISNAQTSAQDYGDKYKLQAVRGSMVVTGRNSIAWGTTVPGGGVAISLFYADGVAGTPTFTLPNGSLTGLSTTARTYIHYNYGATTFVPTTNLAGLSTTSALIAVFDPGATATDPGSLSIVGGATYISGNNIVTGSINAANIKTAAITADLMNVQRLDAMNLSAGKIFSGVIEMDADCNIHSAGKTTYTNMTAGIFLGYEDSGIVGYKFNFGDANSYVRWGGAGSALQVRSTGGLALTGDSLSPYTSLTFTKGGGGAGVIHLYHDSDALRGSRIRSDGAWDFDWEVYGQKFIQTGNTFQIQTQRTVAHSQSMPEALGLAGEICWDANYLYICVAANNWRRIRLDPLDTW